MGMKESAFNDAPPTREPSTSGPDAGPPFRREAVDEALTRYYEIRGWDPETGVPTQDTLSRLRLCEVAEDLANP